MLCKAFAGAPRAVSCLGITILYLNKFACRLTQEVVARARQVIAAHTSGAAIQADTAGRLEQRYGRYRGLVQQLLNLSTNDKEAAAGLLTRALAVAGQDGA